MKQNTRILPIYRQSLAGTLLRARESVMGPLRPILRQINLTDPQWRVLRVLADEGSLDPSSLAEASLLHTPSVSRILSELLSRKLILREISPEDKRRSIITISEDGLNLVKSVALQVVPILENYADIFGKERLRNLMNELSEFAEALQKENNYPPNYEFD